MPGSSKIAITGRGVICAIGSSVTEVHRSLCDEVSGIEPTQILGQKLRFDTVTGEVALTNSELTELLGVESGLPRTTLLAIKAAEEAVSNSGIDLNESTKAGLIIGTTVGGMDRTEGLFAAHESPDEFIPSHHCGFVTDYLANYFGAKVYSSTISTACSSGANAILIGARLLKQGIVDVVIVGGTDALSAFTINGFNSLMILDNKPCKPFSEERHGLNLGEGAAFLIMEREETAKKRSASIYGYLTGYANTNDAFHQTASSPDGRGAYNAMNEAVGMAGLKPQDIDYINVHGTGTENNDLTESIAMQKLFEKNIPEHSSTKGFTGHCLGAAGAIEAVISLLSMEHNEIYANLRFGNPVIEKGALPATKTASKVVQHVLSNSFGFGGCDTSLVFSGGGL